jgi:hypothetical protein
VGPEHYHAACVRRRIGSLDPPSSFRPGDVLQIYVLNKASCATVEVRADGTISSVLQ